MSGPLASAETCWLAGPTQVQEVARYPDEGSEAVGTTAGLDAGESWPPRDRKDNPFHAAPGLGNVFHAAGRASSTINYTRTSWSTPLLSLLTVVPVDNRVQRFHVYITHTRMRAADGSDEREGRVRHGFR